MFKKITSFINKTSIEILVGGSYTLAIIVGFIGYITGLDSTNIGSFIFIGLILFIGGFGFVFSIYKTEYPLYFKIKITGKPAQIFSIFWLIIVWGFATLFFIGAFRFSK